VCRGIVVLWGMAVPIQPFSAHDYRDGFLCIQFEHSLRVCHSPRTEVLQRWWVNGILPSSYELNWLRISIAEWQPGHGICEFTYGRCWISICTDTLKI
jgi:hypothetical protein